MSRTRIVKGNITKIIGGNYKRYSKDDIVNIGSKVIQIGKEGGVTYGEPEAPSKKLLICNKKPTPYPDVYGKCIYYRWRFENFLERHKSCSHLPPKYYFGPMLVKSDIQYFGKYVDNVKEWWSELLNTEPLEPPYPSYEKGMPIVRESYGYKYCIIFSNYLMPKLSSDGKVWLRKAREYLQEYMEKGLENETFTSKYNKKFNKKVKDKTLKDVELNDNWFQEFAFATHPDAYLDAGLISLSIHDKRKIAFRPDLVEWMSIGTLEQAWYVGKEQLLKWKDDVSDYTKEKYEEAKKVIERGKNELKKYF
ncbi:hypothetical protein PG291_09635 [Riemerella anatipestifer]|nr:hypothetical protein [Riemerella anatipestifer]